MERRRGVTFQEAKACRAGTRQVAQLTGRENLGRKAFIAELAIGEFPFMACDELQCSARPSDSQCALHFL
jgi:hypothetical protein